MSDLTLNPNFVPSVSSKIDTIHGKLDAVAVKGNFVSQVSHGAGGGDAELELADGARGYYLPRDVMENNEAERLEMRFHETQPDFVNPYVRNESECSAHQIERGEFEGTDLLDASITNSIAQGTKLTTKAGKLATIDASQEAVGHVTSVLPPANGGAVRIEVKFYN